MKNDEGLSRIEKKCLFRVLADEIPRIRGSIDGVQRAANEARNRVHDLGCAIAIEMKEINTKLIGSK
jgi:archaellum component FlaC